MSFEDYILNTLNATPPIKPLPTHQQAVTFLNLAISELENVRPVQGEFNQVETQAKASLKNILNRAKLEAASRNPLFQGPKLIYCCQEMLIEHANAIGFDVEF